MCNIMYIIYVVYLSGEYTACLSGEFLCRKTSLTGGFCRLAAPRLQCIVRESLAINNIVLLLSCPSTAVKVP